MGDETGGDDEKPVHTVFLNAFDLGKFTVTNSEFGEFLKESDYVFPQEFLNAAGPDYPVTHINWFDAVAYCQWLSETRGDHYRLPTEAEWEYAARSGSTTNIFPWGTRGWSERTELHQRFKNGPEQVGSFEPNEFGLHDMGINVHEWCLDWYDPSYYGKSPRENPKGPSSGTRRSSRGGSWRHQIKITRCAARSSIPPEYRYADYGFRLLRELN